MKRRQFLRLSAGGVILGLDLLGCATLVPQAPPSYPAGLPGYLLIARDRMLAERKPGLLFRVPENFDHRRHLGHFLINSLEREVPDFHHLFCEAVAVCVDPATFDRIAPGEAVALIDGSTRTIDALPMLKIYDFELSHRMLSALVHGADLDRLKQRARDERAASPLSVLATLETLRADDVEPFAERAATIASLLVHEKMIARTGLRRRTLEGVLEFYFYAADGFAGGPSLPYGIIAKQAGICGGWDDEYEPTRDEILEMAATRCGMGSLSKHARTFARFLAPK